MTALKAYQVEDFVRKNLGKPGLYLIYGTDQGLIGEIGSTLATLPDAETVALDMSELDEAPEKLAVHALTPSLFGAMPAIRIRNANKSLAPALEHLLAEQLRSPVVIEAGNLPPRDKLRQLVEQAGTGWTLPCYADDEKSLEKLIRAEFERMNVSIEPDAVSLLVSILGNDREITRRELEKLINFAGETKQISLENVQTLCGDNAAITLDQAVDGAASGNLTQLEAALNRIFTSGMDAQRLLAAMSRHFLLLRSLRAKIEAGTSAQNAMNTTYPRPHFSRKNSIQQQLQIWNSTSLASACRRLQAATLQSRQHPLLGETVTRRALLGICLAATRRKSAH